MLKQASDKEKELGVLHKKQHSYRNTPSLFFILYKQSKEYFAIKIKSVTPVFISKSINLDNKYTGQ